MKIYNFVLLLNIVYAIKQQSQFNINKKFTNSSEQRGSLAKLNSPYSNQQMCDSFLQLRNILAKIDHKIQNIMQYSLKKESLDSVLKRIGNKKYKEFLNQSKQKYQLILYEMNIGKLKNNMIYITPEQLAQYFSDVIYRSRNYCASLPTVGYVILRFIFHNFIDAKHRKIFFNNLFDTLKKKNLNEEMKLIPQLLQRLYDDISVQLISTYFELQVYHKIPMDIIVQQIVDIIEIDFNFIKLYNSSFESQNFNVIKQVFEKWVLKYETKLKQQNLIIKIYILQKIRMLNLNIYNSDIQKLLTELINLIKNDYKQLSKYSLLHYEIVLPSNDKLYEDVLINNNYYRDLIFELYFYLIKTNKNADLPYFMEPYKHFKDEKLIDEQDDDSLSDDLEKEDTSKERKQFKQLKYQINYYNMKKRSQSNKEKGMIKVFILKENNIKFKYRCYSQEKVPNYKQAFLQVMKQIQIPKNNYFLKKIRKEYYFKNELMEQLLKQTVVFFNLVKNFIIDYQKLFNFVSMFHLIRKNL